MKLRCHIGTNIDTFQMTHSPNLWCMPSGRPHCVRVCDCKCPVKQTVRRRLQNDMQSFSVVHNLIAGSLPAVTVRANKWMCGFSSDYSVHPAACLRCCGGEAGFHLSSLLHTEREGEKWEITVLPASLNLGHRASGGNTPGSFSLWVTLGQDCCWGSLALSPTHPDTTTAFSLSVTLPPTAVLF